MAYIQISNINGTPPFQFYVCDYGGNNCVLVQTEYDPIYWPINVFVPLTFEGIQSFMLKIIDFNSCETCNEFIIVQPLLKHRLQHPHRLQHLSLNISVL